MKGFDHQCVEEEILRCPICFSGTMKIDVAEVHCENPKCNYIFPVANGCPILINEVRSVFRFSDFVEGKETYFRQRYKWLEIINTILPSCSHNLVSKRNFKKLSSLLQPEGVKKRVLIVGSGEIGEGIQSLLDNPDLLLTETDVALGRRVSLICDGHDLPFKDCTFDAVIIQAVLEHVIDPVRCVKEINRVLKIQGVVYSETPFMQQVHGGIFDFTRFTARGHRRLFRDFEEIDAGMAGGPGMALSWSWQYFLRSFSGDSKIAKHALSMLGRITSFYFKYFDYLLVHSAVAHEAASSFYFLGRKNHTVINDHDVVYKYSIR
jgi:SAM-dependent methyltransferase